MLTYVVGDLFQSPAHVLVNTVNTVGVMGKGIAKTFKKIYPEMFKEYQQLCERKKITIGKLWLYKASHKWILNFPTKTTWRQPSRMEYIEKGLETFVASYAERGITSIAFPALGCGNGELNWDKQVRPLMAKYLRKLPIDTFIYVYKKNGLIPEHKNIKEIAEWLRAEPETLSFEEVWVDLEKIIGAGIQLKSFYENEEFSAALLPPKKGIRITTGAKHIDIEREELLDFWNVIRSYGFMFSSVVPSFAAQYHDFLLAVFAKLPYLREIAASKDFRKLETTQTRGLQYIPKPDVSYPLFETPEERLIAV